ncbi:MAG: hypothetical protein GXY67_02755 [Clostridiales bacterium]|nr:hypothetical protein [Clostridiales bacterium]
MGVTAVSNEMLLAKGIPEAFLVALGIHILAETKVDWRKYLVMSFLFILMPYLLRQFPISTGINTVLSLFGLIFVFQLLYRSGLQKLVRTIITPIIILILILVAEILNLLILSMMYGFEAANVMFKTPSGWAQCLYTWPSTVILALLLFASHQILKTKRKRKAKDGKDTEGIGS